MIFSHLLIQFSVISAIIIIIIIIFIFIQLNFLAVVSSFLKCQHPFPGLNLLWLRVVRDVTCLIAICLTKTSFWPDPHGDKTCKRWSQKYHVPLAKLEPGKGISQSLDLRPSSISKKDLILQNNSSIGPPNI